MAGIKRRIFQMLGRLVIFVRHPEFFGEADARIRRSATVTETRKTNKKTTKRLRGDVL